MSKKWIIIYVMFVACLHLLLQHGCRELETWNRITALEERFDAHDPNACRLLIHAHMEFDNDSI